MEPNEDVWSRLSRSSLVALRWAAALARSRAERAGLPVDDAEADEFDLLVGIMLSHPGESEPRRLLAHVGASAADVLPPDYPMPGKELERHSAEVPADRPPELTGEANSAVRLSAGLGSGAEVIELRALFGGLLYDSNRVSSAFRDLFAEVGLTDVIDGYREYLADESGDYATFLLARHPYSAGPVEIPDYKADKAAVGDDLVDIRAEVDAFAYLLASRSLQPPLAVGLFGDWGSGKTYFMESVRNRIAQLVGGEDVREARQDALPFWKQIVQIDFNAWHYVEGDLWASLVEHVFSELRVAGDKGDTELAKRQKHWLDQIEAKRRERADVINELDDKKKAKGTARRALERARERRREEEKQLEQAQRQAVADLTLATSKKAARKALAGFADQATDGTAGQALRAIDDARSQLRRGTVAFGAYPWDRTKTLLASAALLAVPMLVLVLAQVDAVPVTAQVFAGVSAALGLLTGALRSVTSWAKQRLDELEEAETEVKADIEAQRKGLEASVRAAAEKLAAAEAAVEALAARDQALADDIAVLEARAMSVTSGQILGEFVAERVGSTDYRRLLGTAALIQRDFGVLSKLIEEQNEEFLRTDAGGAPPGPEIVNRVILYIDDLDRCEPKQVIAVLQAVHLLLAFPLFVVVVAVDSRWLAHSLADQYPVLFTPDGNRTSPAPDAEDADQPTPSDYLEKIFQVPFWIDPLGERARKSLVRGMLQGNLAPAGAGGEQGVEADPLTFSDASEAMVQTMFGRTRAVRLQTAALSVTPSELRFLDELAPLLGDTPRSIKRFVNVYQLLRVLPVPPGTSSPRYEEASAVLLALTDGAPGLYAALYDELQEELPGATLASAVTSVRPNVLDEELARYDAWALAHADLAGAPAEDFVEPARRVRRFSFRY